MNKKIETSLSDLRHLPEIFESLQQKSNSPVIFRKGLAVINKHRSLFLKLMFGLGVSFMLTFIIFAVFSWFYLNFFSDSVGSWVEDGRWGDWAGWLAWMDSVEGGMRTVGKWVVQIVIFLLMGYFSWKLAFLFMVFWTDEMVLSVKRKYRDLPEEPFSLSRFLPLLKVGIKMSVRNLVYVTFFACCALVPIIGVIFTGLGVAWSSGADIFQTVLMVYAEEDLELAAKVKQQKKRFLHLGMAQAAFFFAPFMNFMLVPFGYIVHVIGLTALVEESLQLMNQQKEV